VSPEDKQVFLDELAIIQSQVEAMGVFSLADINAALNAINERFDRVAAFARAVATPVTPSSFNRPQAPPPNDHIDTQFMNVISLQSGAAGKARLSFMNAEKQTRFCAGPLAVRRPDIARLIELNAQH
jgi:hypothetical protein